MTDEVPSIPRAWRRLSRRLLVPFPPLGGNSLVAYNSEWVRKAMEALGSRVVGIVEK